MHKFVRDSGIIDISIRMYDIVNSTSVLVWVLQTGKFQGISRCVEDVCIYILKPWTSALSGAIKTREHFTINCCISENFLVHFCRVFVIECHIVATGPSGRSKHVFPAERPRSDDVNGRPATSSSWWWRRGGATPAVCQHSCRQGMCLWHLLLTFSNSNQYHISIFVVFCWCEIAFSALTLLVGQQEWWDAGAVICLGEVQICILPGWCHCHSLSLDLVNPDWFNLPSFTFLVPAHPGSPGHNPESRKMVVIVVIVC